MNTDKQISELAKLVIASQEEWLQYWLKQHLPPVVVRWISERKHLSELARYFERRQIRVVTYQHELGKKHLMIGSREIATFDVKFHSHIESSQYPAPPGHASVASYALTPNPGKYPLAR